jgi:hypothetical protein
MKATASRRPPPRAAANKPAGKPAARQSGQAAARQSGQTAARRTSLGGHLLITALFVVLLAVALPTALLLALALLPAFVAVITDRSPARSATISVGALNLAGTWPFLLKLWTTGHTVVHAMEIIVQPAAWLVIYASAAVGWLLYLSFPALVSACMSIFAGRRMAQLRAQQKKLVEEWGPEVATNPASQLRG